MAKKITLKGLTVQNVTSNKQGSTVVLSTELKPIRGAAPGQPNATAKNIITLRDDDPKFVLQFVGVEKIDIEISIN